MKQLTFVLILQLVSFCLFPQDAEKSPEIYPEIVYPTFEGGEANTITTFSQKELSIVVFWQLNAPSMTQMKLITGAYDDWAGKFDIQLIVIARTTKDIEATKASIEKIRKKQSHWKDDYIVFLDEYSRDIGFKFSKDIPNVNEGTPITLYITKNSEIIQSKKSLSKPEEINNIILNFFNEGK